MTRLAMSRAAGWLVSALVRRAGGEENRILLTACRSTDWQSLTFVGERHELSLRILGPDAAALVDRLTEGLADAELTMPRGFVADIALTGPPASGADGSIGLGIEALTIAD